MTVGLEKRRADLLVLRARMEHATQYADLAHEESGEINSAGGDQHLADHASETLERELDETLEENAEEIIREIDQALVRLEDGTYGTCEACGKPIPAERLDAVPYATLCVEDRRRLERG